MVKGERRFFSTSIMMVTKKARAKWLLDLLFWPSGSLLSGIQSITVLINRKAS